MPSEVDMRMGKRLGYWPKPWSNHTRNEITFSIKEEGSLIGTMSWEVPRHVPPLKWVGPQPTLCSGPRQGSPQFSNEEMTALERSGQTLSQTLDDNSQTSERRQQAVKLKGVNKCWCKKKLLICVQVNMFKTKVIFQIQIFEAQFVLSFSDAGCHHLEDSKLISIWFATKN